MPLEEPEIDPYSADDIKKQVARLLRDLDNPEPPIKLADVRRQLNLDLNYYSKSDLGLLDEISHRLIVGGKQVLEKPARMLEVVKKAGLRALIIQEDRKIYIDDEVPEPKHRHIEAHEILHDITPWHRDFLLGDDEYTLRPECHAIIESEANFGAGQLLFLGDRFSQEARDSGLNWSTIQALKKRYGNTLTTTLWHAIEERNPSHPVVGLISQHPKRPSIGGGLDGDPCKHFIRSHGFRTQFPHVTSTEIYQIVRSYADFRARGPNGQATVPLTNANHELWEFRFESFCNGYDFLTFATAVRALPSIV